MSDAPAPQAPQPGFFSRLFDFSFTYFITTSLVKLLYALAIGVSGITVLFLIGAGFSGDDPAVGVVFLLISPVLFFFMVILSRVYLESIVVFFRIAEHTAETARKLDGRG
ncbi:MAG TPA: DUF4282 domain-containing protein [Dehalococcoidia bacterium]